MNKRIIIIIGIMAIVLIGFGGKLYMDKKAEESAKEEQRNLLETERESAIVLKQTFANIKAIKFVKSSGPDPKTGSYHMRIKMTNTQEESTEFTYSYWKKDRDIGSYGIENEQVQIEGITIANIQVTYSNGLKGTI